MFITSKENAVNYVKYFDGRCELYGILSTTTGNATVIFPFIIYDYSVVVSAEGMSSAGIDFCEYFLQDENQSLQFAFNNSINAPPYPKYKGSWQLKGRWK
ncbi:hypothetical protein [Fusobacterium varium]|uniref:hypothetical protein n=1 Tax=Fusobacterium varium TaxID=856 RepID=UPI0035632D46